MSHYQVRPDDFDIVKPIGKGTFATVYLGKHKTSNQTVAIKVFSTNCINEDERRQFCREVETMAQFQHPAILGFRGFYLPPVDSTNTPIIVTDLMSNGSLMDVMFQESQGNAPDWYSPTVKMISAFGIAAGLAYIHLHSGIHRDVKPANVLLDDKYEPHICDFGMAKFQEANGFQSVVGGTPLWMAPELYEQGQYNEKVDVYAYGIILYSLVTGKIPFGGKISTFQISSKVSRGERPELDHETVQPFYFNLINACWAQDPRERPNIIDVCKALRETDQFLPGTNIETVRAYQQRIFDLKMRADTGELEAMYQFGMSNLPDNPAQAYNYLEPAARNGSAMAAFELGKMFFSTDYQNQNYALAQQFFVQAGQGGIMAASLYLGQIIERQQGKDAAYNYYKFAADNGVVEAQFLLGQTDATYLVMAAQNDHPQAAVQLAGTMPKEAIPLLLRHKQYKVAAQCYEKLGDMKEAHKYYQQAGDKEGMSRCMPADLFELRRKAEAGDVSAAKDCAELLMGKKEPVKAAYFYKIAALAGDADAQYQCGRMLEKGTGVNQDLLKGVYFYKMAADQGHLEGILSMARCLSDGIGVTQDQGAANAYLAAAGVRGDAKAASKVAYNLDTGIGCQQNPDASEFYWHIASDHNDVIGMINYGVKLMDKDREQSRAILKAVADQGETLGIYNYAVLMNGKKEDKPEATKYFKIAADRGMADAMVNYAINCKKTSEMRIYAQKAAFLGHPSGQAMYAQFLLQDGNKDEAIRFFKLAAEQGSNRAMRHLKELGL